MMTLPRRLANAYPSEHTLMPHTARLALFLFAVLLGGAPDLAMAANRGVATSTPLTQTYTWYDGEREHMAWVNPTLVAEFNPPALEAKSALKRALPTARALPGKGPGIRLWLLDGSSTPTSTLRKLSGRQSQGKYSPVLHDGSTAASRMRALPGNIIVYLDPAWSEAKVDTWLQSRGLVVIKKLELGTNIYILKTDPGLASLEIANALYRSGEVVAAFPDWWQETVAR